MWKKNLLRVVITSVLVGAGGTGVVIYKMVDKEPTPTAQGGGVSKPLPAPGEPDEVALVRRLQEDCAKEPLRGAWVEKAEVVPGDKLVLHGLVDRRPQAEAVAERARTLLGEMPALAAKCPNGVGTAEMKVLPIHDRLKALQAGWSKPPLVSATQQTRLDGAYYSAPNRLHVSGVTLAAGDVAESVRDAVRGQLETEPERAATKGQDMSKVLDIDVQLKALPNPAGTIEEAARKAGTLPGLALDDARYDAVGTLQLAGVVQPGHAKKFDALVSEQLEPKWKADGVVIAAEGRPGWSAQGLREVDPDKLRKQLQAEFAGSKKPLRLQTRLDRAVFRRDPAQGLQLHFDGLCVYSGPNEADAAKNLVAELESAVKEVPGVKGSLGFAVVPDGVVMKTGLARALQADVSGVPELGGVGVVVTAIQFDKDGGMVPKGLNLGDEERRRRVEELFRKRVGGPVDSPQEEVEQADSTVFAKYDPPKKAQDSDVVKARLRKWLAEEAQVNGKKVNGRLDELGYRPKGDNLAFQVTGVWLYEGKKPDDKQIKELLNDVVKPKANELFKAAFKDENKDEEPPADFDIFDTGLRPLRSPLNDLREQTTALPDLRGAVFADVGYDESGKLLVKGMIAGKEQEKKVKDLLLDGKVGEDGALRKVGDKTEDPILSGLQAINYADLVKEAQKRLAGGGDSPLTRTRVKDALFVYKKEGEGLRLFLTWNLIFYRSTRDETKEKVEEGVRGELLPVAAEFAKAFLPEKLRKEDLDIASLTVEDNPILDLQRRAAKDDALGVVLFQRARFNLEGELELTVLADEQAGGALEQFVKKAALGPAKLVRKPFDWPQKGGNWPTFLKNLQASLAGEKDKVATQTRIDGASFAYEGDSAKPHLKLVGLCIADGEERAVGEALLKKIQDIFKQDATRLPLEADLDVKGIKARKFPRNDIQAAVFENKDLDGAVVTGAKFDASGKIVPIGQGVKGKEDAFRRLIEEKLKGTGLISPEPEKKEPQCAPEAGAPPPPGFSLDGLKFVNWQDMLTALRHRFAEDPVDPLARQTRVDRAYWRFDPNGNLLLQFELICLLPEGDEAGHRQALKKLLYRYFHEASVLGDKVGESEFDVDLPPDDAHPFRASPVITLQEMAVDLRLYDALFEDAVYDGDGRLHLRVYRGESVKPQQIADLIATPRAREALKPALGKLAGQDKEELDKPRPFPWRGEGPEKAGLKERLQKRFADSDVPVAWQTRVDRAYFRYDMQATRQMHLEGVNLWVGAPGVTLPDALKPVCREVLPEPAYQVVADKVVRKPNPAPALQLKLAGKPEELDGILFEDAGFDARGRLAFPVVTADSDVQRIEVRRLLQAPPLADGLLPADPERRALEVVVRTFDWAGMLKNVRAWAAGPTAPDEARRTRLDRAYFTREDGGCQLQLDGATLLTKPEFDPPTAVWAKVTDSVGKRCLTYLRPLKLRLPGETKPLARKVVWAEHDLRAALRRDVAGRRSLDGVNVTAVVYDEAGRVALEGHWVGGKDQAHDLEDALSKALEPEPAKLKKYGTAPLVERLRVVRTDLLLRDLRKWIVDKTEVEEVLFDRLYFDADGKLRIDGFFTRPDDRKPSEEAGLEGLLAYPIVGRSLLGLDPDGVARPAVEGKDVIHLVPRASLVAYLRQQVLTDPALDGIRIDRCWYDGDAAFVPNGLEDAAGQSAGLKVLLDGAREGAAFKAHLAGGWRLGRFTVVPLGKMLHCLKRLMPADPVYDGVTLDRAYHDAANHLVITGAVAVMDYPGLDRARTAILNQRREAQARKALAAAVATDPNWRLRLSYGGPDLVMKTPRADLALAESSFESAAQLYGHERKVARALADLDTAIFNNPADATAWYFRAVCELALGDDEAARRDLRRVLAFDGGKPPLVERVIDYARLGLVQGINRARASLEGQKLSFAVPADQSAAALMKELCEKPLKAPVIDVAPGWDTPLIPRTPPYTPRCGPPCWLPL